MLEERPSPERQLTHAIIAEEIRPKCEGRSAEFVDYVSAPSRAQARVMCAGCPLLELCDEAARHRRPGWGVWGGRVYGIPKRIA